MMDTRIKKTNSSALKNAAHHLRDCTPQVLLGGVTVKLSFPSQDPLLVSCYLSLALPDGKARLTNFMTEGSSKTHAAAAMLAVTKKALADLKGSEWESVAQWVLDGVTAHLKTNGMFDDASNMLESEDLF